MHQRTGQAVVEQRGGQNAKDDGNKVFKACREDEREQLGFVADFGQRDHAC